MKPVAKFVDVYRSEDWIVIESTSKLRALRTSNGWRHVAPARGLSASKVGEIVIAALDESGVITAEELPVLPQGATVASEAAGFTSEDAMLAAAVESAGILLRDGRWKVIPMVNMGPGKGWSGHADAPEVTHEGEWSVEELGAAVLEALDAAARLSRV